MIVVLRVQTLPALLEFTYYVPFLIKIHAEPMIGFLPVYASQEEAERDFPDGPFAEIEALEVVK